MSGCASQNEILEQSVDDSTVINSVASFEPSERIRASRIFAGPNQYPPKDFPAYGILAFTTSVNSSNEARYIMLCEAYLTALPSSSSLSAVGIDSSSQMATVWPINDNSTANLLNKSQLFSSTKDICKVAIKNYNLISSLEAINDAGKKHFSKSNHGPFLLAWAPSLQKGEPRATVLVADLSNVTTAEQADSIFIVWRRDVEENPDLWSNGWNLEKLRISIRLWVDKYGDKIFSALNNENS